MTRLLKCEYLKTRRKYIFITAALTMAVYFLWTFHGSGYNAEGIKHGWALSLYQQPLVNTIFMPFLCIITASRLAGTEHRGAMLKQLCTMADKGKIYDAKLIYGIFIMSLCVAIGWTGLVLFGMHKGYSGIFPFRLYALYLAYTLAVVIEIYVMQHALALIFKNQAVGFFVGITGEFAGLFSLFLPNIEWLRKIVPYGHFGQLDFIGMYGWTKETRMRYVYFRLMDTEHFVFAVIVLTFIFYIVGRYIFVRKET